MLRSLKPIERWWYEKLLKGELSVLLIHARYQPVAIGESSMCDLYATTLADLKTAKGGSIEWFRLTNGANTLFNTLEATRSSRPAQIDTDLAALANDQLIQKTTSILRSLLDARDEQRKSEAQIAKQAGPSVQTAAGPAGEVVASTSAPAPEAVCPYCRGKCVGPGHVAYATLHWDDPGEQKKRDELATREMLHQIPRGLPDWYRE